MVDRSVELITLTQLQYLDINDAKFYNFTSLIRTIVKPFSANFPLLYPQKTSDNLRFSDVFRGYRSGT